MCGGRGTRLGSETEKPLYPIAGTPMVDRVVAALAGSRVETVYAAVSPHAPETREHLSNAAIEGKPLSLVQTPGDGYVADLQAALATVDTPVLTVAADLPLLAPVLVDRVLDRFAAGEGHSLTVVVPAELKRALGASCDTEFDGYAPTGVNVVADSDSETMYTSYDARLAVNVNRQSDADLAEELCD
ncbi:NTP transferase domain-containing protein [Haloarchaeobius sp. HME9146]|uniref:NTP transferase domain-containing protein n=1 Tax=Haloarchaeobius sp. HME9146 TaxID=2978732 RepID=UPI0021BFADDF|nr:NTP transferase domain-containing protein [Haloarchaeobius sp. HME9146]MCT9095634.1 NTP transferase domain-containing protein [Haloarchaeobius sp. HME9146]